MFNRQASSSTWPLRVRATRTISWLPTATPVSQKNYQLMLRLPTQLTVADVAMVFAARLLIRFATLAPESVDLRRSGREIEELAAMLKRGTFHELADQIQAVLTRARNKRVLPPRSLAASPRRGVAELHPDLGQQHGHHTDVADASSAAAPPLGSTGFDLLSDFQFADELFNGAALSDGDVSAAEASKWWRDLCAVRRGDLAGGGGPLLAPPLPRRGVAFCCSGYPEL